ITQIESGHIPTALWVSKRWMSKLPENLQKLVMDVGRELEPWAANMAWGFNQKAVALWKKNGAEVIKLSAQEQARLTSALAPLGDEFLGKDKTTKDMYALLKKTLAVTSDKQR
ncbi:MAG: hypothetical protein VXY05_04710, partial [Pseudomonadota bacterium]|nr:hypothetical protein [Pseudomonadota bacterium]